MTGLTEAPQNQPRIRTIFEKQESHHREIIIRKSRQILHNPSCSMFGYFISDRMICSSSSASSVQHVFKRNHSLASLLFSGQSGIEPKPWHDPSFMKECELEAVENWLSTLIETNGWDVVIQLSGCVNPSQQQTIFNAVDSVAYLRLLEAYARSKIAGAPQKSEYWIGRLEKHYADAAKSYRSEFDCGNVDVETSSSPSPEIETSKPEYLPKRERRSRRDDFAAYVRDLQPTVECYNAVIEAWGYDNDLISVIRSRRWLNKLVHYDVCQFPINHPLRFMLHPNARSYDLYLHACSRGLGKQHKLHKQRAEEADEILRYRMSPDAALAIRPTTESFNYVLRAWTRCRKEESVASRVMTLVREMEVVNRNSFLEKEINECDEWKTSIAPNTKTYTVAMDSWIIVAGLKSDRWHSQQLSLDNTYNQIVTSRKRSILEDRSNYINAHSSQDDGSDEMENATEILKYMKTLQEIGCIDVNATVIGYNTVLSGWAKLANTMRSDVPLKSEAILREMIESYEQGNESAAPDVISYNAVIKAWCRTKRPNSASRCEWWLRKMLNGVISSDCKHMIPKPNVQTYNLVMEAWLQLQDPARVQDLLLEMDATENVTPNSESFSKVIRVWLQDELSNQHYGLSGISCENAWKWLKELIDREKSGQLTLGSAPELYSSILKTAARTKARGENILTVGQLTFSAMRESRFGIDALAYEWLLEIGLKVLRSPIDHVKRQGFLESFVQQCRNDGYLSNKFVQRLKTEFESDVRLSAHDRSEIYGSLLGNPPFPESWTRNVSKLSLKR